MLDTVGPELQVVNKSERPVSLQEETLVVLTPDQDKEATSNLLPINFSGLAKVCMIEIYCLAYLYKRHMLGFLGIILLYWDLWFDHIYGYEICCTNLIP